MSTASIMILTTAFDNAIDNIATLKAENAALKAENAALKSEVANRKDGPNENMIEVVNLESEITRNVRTINWYKNEMAKHKDQLDDMGRSKRCMHDDLQSNITALKAELISIKHMNTVRASIHLKERDTNKNLKAEISKLKLKPTEPVFGRGMHAPDEFKFEREEKYDNYDASARKVADNRAVARKVDYNRATARKLYEDEVATAGMVMDNRVAARKLYEDEVAALKLYEDEVVADAASLALARSLAADVSQTNIWQ
jgi:FtsZ-binding cell division protein ZapB